MRTILIISTFLFCPYIFGQVGQTAAQIAIDIGTSTLPETESLVSIRMSQDAVLEHSKDIAQKTAAIVVLKKAELKSLTDTPAQLEQTTPWKLSIYNLESIIQYNTNSIQLLTDFPDVTDIGTESLVLIAEQAYLCVGDITSIAQGGKDNMMLPTDRYKLISKVNERLQELLEISSYVNSVIRTSILLSGEIPTDYTYDISVPFGETIERLENIIIGQ